MEYFRSFSYANDLIRRARQGETKPGEAYKLARSAAIHYTAHGAQNHAEEAQKLAAEKLEEVESEKAREEVRESFLRKEDSVNQAAQASVKNFMRLEAGTKAIAQNIEALGKEHKGKLVIRANLSFGPKNADGTIEIRHTDPVLHVKAIKAISTQASELGLKIKKNELREPVVSQGKRQPRELKEKPPMTTVVAYKLIRK